MSPDAVTQQPLWRFRWPTFRHGALLLARTLSVSTSSLVAVPDFIAAIAPDGRFTPQLELSHTPVDGGWHRSDYRGAAPRDGPRQALQTPGESSVGPAPQRLRQLGPRRPLRSASFRRRRTRPSSAVAFRLWDQSAKESCRARPSSVVSAHSNSGRYRGAVRPAIDGFQARAKLFRMAALYHSRGPATS